MLVGVLRDNGAGKLPNRSIPVVSFMGIFPAGRGSRTGQWRRCKTYVCISCQTDSPKYSAEARMQFWFTRAISCNCNAPSQSISPALDSCLLPAAVMMAGNRGCMFSPLRTPRTSWFASDLIARIDQAWNRDTTRNPQAIPERPKLELQQPTPRRGFRVVHALNPSFMGQPGAADPPAPGPVQAHRAARRDCRPNRPAGRLAS